MIVVYMLQDTDDEDSTRTISDNERDAGMFLLLGVYICVLFHSTGFACKCKTMEEGRVSCCWAVTYTCLSSETILVC